MTFKPTLEQLNIVEVEVIQYLTKFKNVYSKPMYKALGMKEKGFSLNKFRVVLYNLEKVGKVKRDGDILPYWNIK